MWTAVVGGLALLGGYAVVRGRTEAQRLHLTRVDVPVRGLPEVLNGFEIIHLSDLHLRGYGPYEQTLIRALRTETARVVVITGDFLGSPEGAAALIPLLMEIGRDRIMFGVLGNHDHKPPVNTQALARDLARIGVRLLVNDADVITHRGHRLHLVGVDDPHTQRADVTKAFSALPAPLGNEREPVIVLAHSPDIYYEAAAAGADLILAGHTHGGQICLPGGYPVTTNTRLGRKFARGLVNDGTTPIFISRGIGTTKLRMRLFCPPEVAVIRLVRDNDARRDVGRH